MKPGSRVSSHPECIEHNGDMINSARALNPRRKIWNKCGMVPMAAALALGGIVSTAFAEQEGTPPRPDLGTVQVTKFAGTNSVRLAWSDGSAPFAVARSETADFTTSNTGTFVSRTATTPIDDVGALTDGKTYYYQIPDANSDPFVLGVARLGGGAIVAGDTVTIDGWGFFGSPTVYFAGEEATPSVVTPTQLTASFPLAGATGSTQVVSRFISLPRPSSRALNRSFNDPWHLANDALHDLYVADRNGNRVWKMNGSTLAWTTVFSVPLPLGLPTDGSDNVYVADGSPAPANVGNIWRITSGGSNSIWATAQQSTASVFPKALATPRLPNGNLDPSPGTTWLMDASASCIRAVTVGSTNSSCAFSTGALGAFPAGMVWLRSGNMLYTRGNTIFEITPVGTPVASYHILSGVTLSGPGQLAVDRYGDVYGIDRLGNFAFKLRTTSGDQKLRMLFQSPDDLAPSAPRGVALDENTGDVWRSYIHFSDGTAVYRFRRRDRVHVKIRVLDTALAGANLPSGALPPASFPQVDSGIRVALVMASGIFTQAGLEYVVDDSQVITDPTAARDGGVEVGSASTISADETAILGTRSSSENVVYLYVVHHFADSSRNLSSPAGRTYTSDNFSISDLTGSGIIVARFWGAAGGNPMTGIQTVYRGEPVPHELGHFLMSGINNGGSPDPEHTPQTSPNLGRLMYPSLNGFTGVTIPAERTNIWTNTGFSPWIDHF
jgi:hypothetical protein